MIVLIFSIANPLVRISEIETVGTKVELSLYPYKHTYWEEVYYPLTAAISLKYTDYTFTIRASVFSSSISFALINLSFNKRILKAPIPLYMSLGYISPAYIYGFDFNASYFNYSAMNAGMFLIFSPLKPVDIYVKIGALSSLYSKYSAVENKKSLNALLSPVFNTKVAYNIERFSIAISLNPFIYPFIGGSFSYRYR